MTAGKKYRRCFVTVLLEPQVSPESSIKENSVLVWFQSGNFSGALSAIFSSASNTHASSCLVQLLKVVMQTKYKFVLLEDVVFYSDHSAFPEASAALFLEKK